MDSVTNPADLMFIASTVLLLLLSGNRTVDFSSSPDAGDGTDDEAEAEASEGPCLDMDTAAGAALHTFRLYNVFSVLDEDLGYWVKPISTTWFLRFLLNQYDSERWITMFRMTKPAVENLAALLRPIVQRHDTKYRLAIPVLIRVACTLFKLTHNASMLICSEMFAMGRSTVSLVLRNVVQAINITLRSEIAWPTREKIRETESGFYNLCGLPGVLGAINSTHISIWKPRFGSADYYYFKSGGYSLNCQAVVDSEKRFLDLFLGMPRSTNDSRMLRRSSLFHKGMHSTLWDVGMSFEGFSPYLLGDLGYPLLPWLLVPHRERGNLPVAQTLFNKKLRRGRGVVENAFRILKQTFRELLVKSDLSVAFLPDVITCCALLHNVLLGQCHGDVERLLQVLRTEGLRDEPTDEEQPLLVDAADLGNHNFAYLEGTEKRQQLGIFLALQGTGGV